jgi:hypothetical protein
MGKENTTDSNQSINENLPANKRYLKITQQMDHPGQKKHHNAKNQQHPKSEGMILHLTPSWPRIMYGYKIK